MKRFANILSFLLLIGLVYFSFYDLGPQNPKSANAKKTVFSTERAFRHVEQIAKKPHPVGTRRHSLVRNYIVSELQKMDLEVQTQQGYVLNDHGILAKPENIIAKIPGTNPNKKALLLLSHYDSAVHSSFGASDAASGVATILEGIRAFLEQGKPHENDIIILFSDAEEVGLLGAELFVKEHPWAKNVGLVLNFEARGSGGPSNMIVETNGGNSKLINAFAEANPQFPVATSLMYSVYKMLPNDTDSTVFREEMDIPSFFFAFIDDHFDYHTALDLPKNLDKKSLAHQGSYLMPLLDYFSNANLNELASEKEEVYFNFPLLGLFHFPFTWIFPLLILAIVVFVFLVFVGIKKKKLTPTKMLKGGIPFFGSLVVSGLLTFFGWKLVLLVYPQYQEILHGFTYNGHWYIAAFVAIALAVTFGFYHKFHKPEDTKNLLVVPLFFWLLINVLLAFFLKGAAYFLVPVFFGLIVFALLIWQEKPNLFLMLLLCVPAIFVFSPLVQAFPVGLGLGMLAVSSVFMVLLFGLLLPIFGFYRQKGDFAFLFLIVGIVFFTLAHFKSGFSEDRPKPNSLVYVLEAENNRASWNTYDYLLDDWTKAFLGENPRSRAVEPIFESKYNSGFTYTSEAETKLVPKAEVLVSKDSSELETVSYHLKIMAKRPIDRIELFADQKVDFLSFKVNGLTADSLLFNGEKRHIFKDRFQNRLLTYYGVTNDTLRIDFTLPKNQLSKLVMFGSSNDLLENELFSVPPRSPEMIPKPFVLNDAVVVKQSISLE
ncbi:MAG TPA: M20/M25/M40 family metallo-hydrolase [Flavobacteriaceae bacterium]|nr:M20/M25/M40 family metallo-hydrolase [Flavobacteriaceae bacterium]